MRGGDKVLAFGLRRTRAHVSPEVVEVLLSREWGLPEIHTFFEGVTGSNASHGPFALALLTLPLEGGDCLLCGLIWIRRRKLAPQSLYIGLQGQDLLLLGIDSCFPGSVFGVVGLGIVSGLVQVELALQ